jgi:hypothetical protein
VVGCLAGSEGCQGLQFRDLDPVMLVLQLGGFAVILAKCLCKWLSPCFSLFHQVTARVHKDIEAPDC